MLGFLSSETKCYFICFSLETSQLRAELVTCSEDRDELSQSLCQWREKVHSLEKTNADTRSLISILEDDIRAGRKEYEALQSSMEKLNTDKSQVLKLVPFYTFFVLMLNCFRFGFYSFVLCFCTKLLEQVKALEQVVSQLSGEKEQLLCRLNQIKEDHTSANQNTESMVGKIQVSRKLVETNSSWVVGILDALFISNIKCWSINL